MKTVMAHADHRHAARLRGARTRRALAAAATIALAALALPPGAAADPPTDPYATRVMDRPSLVSYWRLGETSGTTADDAKNGRDGVYEGNVTLGAPSALSGDPNPSASFNGGRVPVPMMPSSANFTVEGWMRLNASASSNNNLYGELGAVRLMPRPSGYYAGAWVNGVEYKLQGSTASNVGAWVHWAFVREGASLRLYRNGVLVNQVANLPASATTKLDGDIGKMGTSYPAKGEIDEVSVNSAALSAADIEGDYLSESIPAGGGPPPPPETPPDTYVDGASRGGPCDDSRTVEQAASPATPWCTVERAAEAVGAGGTVFVRGATYPETTITGVARGQTVTFKPYQSETPVLDGLSVTQSSGLRFQGLRISDQTVLDGVTKVDLVGNDISPHGVHVPSGRELLFEGNNIHDLTMDINPSTGHCTPPRCGYGFRVNDGVDITFRDNLFSDIPGDGIQSGTAVDYLIEGNEFERISPFVDPDEHSDSIQFYRGSNGVEISGNYFHETRGPLLLGTQPDESHAGLVVTNNTIVAQTDWGLKVHDCPGLVLANNTVWDADVGVSINDTAAVAATTANVRAFNNVFENFTAAAGFFAFEDYNLVGTGYRQGPHDLAGPPRFVDPDQLDYSLQGSSPAVDAGISTDAPAKDRLGRDRFDQPAVPNTGGGSQPYYDLGAQELTETYQPPAGSYSQMILGTSGLQSYWRLGETTGSTAVDAKSGRNGPYEGTLTKGAQGAISGDSDTSVSFTNGRVNVPAMPTSTDLTVEGWMKMRAGAAGNNNLYGQQGALRLMPRPTGYYAGVWLNGTEYKFSGSGASNVGTWVHWALVRQGATLTLYRNGNPVKQRSVPATATAKLDGDIGRLAGSYPAKGEIDEVAVYGRALSASEVGSHFDLGN
jgi:hypothetical protein